jgi:phage-related protein
LARCRAKARRYAPETEALLRVFSELVAVRIGRRLDLPSYLWWEWDFDNGREFYDDADGNTPVETFLDGLTEKQRNKLVALVEKLGEYGAGLPFPIHPRCAARLRIFYFADANRTFTLLHGISKNTEKLDESEIEVAEERLADHVCVSLEGVFGCGSCNRA